LADERASGRDVILAIADNMRSSLEPLVTKTVAPSLYQVYLHAQDYDRLRTIFPEIEAEAKELLEREMARMNRGAAPVVGRLVASLRPRRRADRQDGPERPENPESAPKAKREAPQRFVSAQGRWSVRFQEDPNGALQPGDVQVVSEFAETSAQGFSSGNPTRRISTTRRLGRQLTQREGADPASSHAVIRYKDDSGEREFWVVKDEIVIGRDAPDVWVDLRL
jgi:hypothetical protein